MRKIVTNPVICNVLGCNQEFETVFAYETHYNSLHRYLCVECKKSLPTPHLLDLHLSEYHDSFFAVKSQREPMYACFIEECHHKSRTPEERKDHCITHHKFPSNFRFDTAGGGTKISTIKNNKSGDTNSSNSEENSQMDFTDDNTESCFESNATVTESNNNKEMLMIEKKMKNFSFGHTKTKTFNSKSTKKYFDKEKSNESGKVSALEKDETFTELKESLP